MFIKSAIPICISSTLLSLVSSMLLYFWCWSYKIMLNTSILLVCIWIILWVYNIIVENLYLGLDTMHIKYIYLKCFYMFLLVEVIFFLSFFWVYFSVSMDLSLNTGFTWPPVYIINTSTLHTDIVSILNILLIGSSLLVSMYHLFITSVLNLCYLIIIVVFTGVLFSYVQYIEYANSFLNVSNGIYASIFYAVTGLHTIHVLIGILFFVLFLYRIYSYYFALEHIFNLIVVTYYWHFVDIIWIFVYITQFINANFLVIYYFFFADLFSV